MIMKYPMTNRYLSLINSEDEFTVQLLESLHRDYEVKYKGVDAEQLFEYVLDDSGYLY